jgi:hypothetical protein
MPTTFFSSAAPRIADRNRDPTAPTALQLPLAPRQSGAKDNTIFIHDSLACIVSSFRVLPIFLVRQSLARALDIFRPHRLAPCAVAHKTKGGETERKEENSTQNENKK